METIFWLSFVPLEGTCFLSSIIVAPAWPPHLLSFLGQPQTENRRGALARRTPSLVKRSSLVVLFPERPAAGRWGAGSQLVFAVATSIESAPTRDVRETSVEIGAVAGRPAQHLARFLSQLYGPPRYTSPTRSSVP